MVSALLLAVSILGVSWLIHYLLFAGAAVDSAKDPRFGLIGLIVAVIGVLLSNQIEEALVRRSIASFCAEHGIAPKDHFVMSGGGGRAIPLWCRKLTLIDDRKVHRVLLVGDPFWGILNTRVRILQEYSLK